MNEKDLEKYVIAPEGMEPEEVLRLFEELLATPQPVNTDKANIFVKRFSSSQIGNGILIHF